jgi:acetoin utilization deacetylase AcuC-like enzyme
MANTGLMFSESGFKHTVPPGHPECPERLAAIQEGLESAKFNLPKIESRLATRAELLRIHTQDHIDLVENTCAASLPYADADTYMMPASWDAALMGAGGAIEACDKVLSGELDNAFCVMRPPGHHAEADHAMGFCLFNNVAIAARWLQEEGGLNKIAILDWDVHHGNGTQHSFYGDPSIYYVSLHQFPHYPGTGLAEERGAENTNLNFPLPAGTSAEVWLETIQNKAVPELEKFDPEFLLISCGFDAHELDPLSSQHLKSHHYGDMTRMVKHLANGNIVSLLEGGYSLDALREAPAKHLAELMA